MILQSSTRVNNQRHYKVDIINQQRSTSIPMWLFTHFLIVVTCALGFVKLYASIFPPPLSRNSQMERKILQEQYLELSWEKQHVHDIKELLHDDSSTLTTLEESNARLSMHLKEMETKLEGVEQERIEIETALRHRRLFKDDRDNAQASKREVLSSDITSNIRGKVMPFPI
mmetsp:Transcript_872/g.1607  ORF Transcript_872/g.1607 Transcript_872/m.1607 type:complete len:171 (-) Transcript_872:197-709(-)